jgi:beta-lactam-binding protein with PASTA domain
MSLSKFILSKKFLYHLLLAVLLFIILLILAMHGLKIYTKHGQSNPVPDFYGLTPGEAAVTARQHELRIIITDSIFIDDAPPGVVVDQIPKAGHGVKQNRTISLTINSSQPEMVTLPQLTDISLRQALVLIENSGLTTGNISYQPSEYNNLVLDAKLGPVKLIPGEKVPKGTKINLIVGREHTGKMTTLPDVTGLTVEEAGITLTNAMLNTGVIIYDESVITAQDSVDAKVFVQSPDRDETPTVPLGTSVDIWATTDQSKLQENQ